MNNIILSILALLFFLQKADSQTYCGLTYYYDAVGNRIERSVTTDCSTGGHGHMFKDSTATDTTNQLTEALYPNPTSGPMQVVFNTPVTEAQIIVIDYLGRQLYTTTTSGTSIPIDLSRYNDGVYLIVVRTGGNSYESTVVKE